MKTDTKYETGYTHESPGSQDNWLEIKGELDRRFPYFKFPHSKRELHDNFFKVPPGTANDATHLLRNLNLNNLTAHITKDITGPAIVRTFWWGFHIEISNETIQSLLSAVDPINKFIVQTCTSSGPAAPYIPIAAAFLAGSLGSIKETDQGKGIYLSMSWFAPGIFIPTGIST